MCRNLQVEKERERHSTQVCEQKEPLVTFCGQGEEAVDCMECEIKAALFLS
jgi:hypothetical protein